MIKCMICFLVVEIALFLVSQWWPGGDVAIGKVVAEGRRRLGVNYCGNSSLWWLEMCEMCVMWWTVALGTNNGIDSYLELCTWLF